MHTTFTWLFTWIGSVDWRTLAPIATTIIAFTALWNWQRQDRAKREAEFLDELIEAALAYMEGLSAPITTLEIAKIAMSSHAPIWKQGSEDDVAVAGAIAFVQRDGERLGKRLIDALEKIRPLVVNLKSRSAKGQLFSFADYDRSWSAVQTLTSQFDTMEWIAAFISSPTWNWENPEVISGLRRVMSMDANQMRATAQINFGVLMEFVRATYQRTYGRWWTRQRSVPAGAGR